MGASEEQANIRRHKMAAVLLFTRRNTRQTEQRYKGVNTDSFFFISCLFRCYSEEHTTLVTSSIIFPRDYFLVLLISFGIFAEAANLFKNNDDDREERRAGEGGGKRRGRSGALAQT